jgi:hypothetical protein
LGSCHKQEAIPDLFSDPHDGIDVPELAGSRHDHVMGGGKKRLKRA